MTKGIFITATGTDVGKTYVTALLVKALRQAGLNAGYYKAALSGAEKHGNRLVPGDADYVCRTAGLNTDPAGLVSYIYETPVSPHLAASREGNPLELAVVKRHFADLGSQYDYIVAEGCGGIICPLRHDSAQTIMLTDVIKALELDVLIVTPAALGAINSTVLTIEYARGLGIGIKGVILNGYETGNFLHEDNLAKIELLGQVPVVTCVAENAQNLDMNIQALTALLGDVNNGLG